MFVCVSVKALCFGSLRRGAGGVKMQKGGMCGEGRGGEA